MRFFARFLRNMRNTWRRRMQLFEVDVFSRNSDAVLAPLGTCPVLERLCTALCQLSFVPTRLGEF